MYSTMDRMAQLNMHLTPAFERMLAQLMKVRRIKTKSEAIRLAVEEALDRAARSRKVPPSFDEWIGLAKRAPLNPTPRFATDRDLWE